MTLTTKTFLVLIMAIAQFCSGVSVIPEADDTCLNNGNGCGIDLLQKAAMQPMAEEAKEEGSLSVSSGGSEAPGLDGGPPLWMQFLSSGERFSAWSNKAQVETISNVNQQGNWVYPFAKETHWLLDGDLVHGAPESWRFAFIEWGFCCAPKCAFGLFGAEPIPGTPHVKLHTFVTKGDPKVEDAINQLRLQPNLAHPILEFAQLQNKSSGFTCKYGYNTTANADVFYCDSEISYPDGRRLVFQDTFSATYHAPLELFYGSSGMLVTNYSTPIVYYIDSMIKECPSDK